MRGVDVIALTASWSVSGLLSGIVRVPLGSYRYPANTLHALRSLVPLSQSTPAFRARPSARIFPPSSVVLRPADAAES
jgi:hypothetical protein